MISDLETNSYLDNNYDTYTDVVPRTELDSHANMAVVGKHAAIVETTGKTAQVKAFSPDCQTLEDMPIVNAVIKWISPYEEKEHILLIKNALYVPSMDHNLVPPFFDERSRTHRQ